MIATIDTNVLVSGMFFGGLPGKILTAAREGVFTLAMTPLLLNELREVLARKKFGLTADMVQLLMEGIEDSATIVYPVKHFQVVNCAVASGSTYIVSGDSHLNEMDELQGITVVTPRQFLDRLKIE